MSVTDSPSPPDAPPASRRAPRIALAALFAGVVVAFFALGGHRYLSLDAVKANRDALLAFTHQHYAAALATNTLTKYGLMNGPRLKVPAPRPAAPMPADGSPVEGNVVVVQHMGCALLVITSDHLPKYGDTVTQEPEGAAAFHGEVIRANAKDGGAYDLIVKVLDGAPVAGPLVVCRPLPAAPPTPATEPAAAAPAPAPAEPK